MNSAIITNTQGTNMGTNERNLENYLNLWKKFETLLEKKDINLSSFSKKWEECHESLAENDYKKIYDDLKKMKKRKDGLKNVRSATYTKLETFISFIDKEHIKINTFDDEKVEHWFDD